jgi:acetylornithine deacetylase/succinyl-diaminopimelate desuccinylase-like protein
MLERSMKKEFLNKSEEKDLITLTKELIKIPSSVADGKEIYEFVYKYLKKRKFDIKFQETKNPYMKYQDFSNLYLKIGNGNGPKIMLNGHLDTVTVDKRHSWKHPPYSAVEENGRIYGRGSADMKAGCASIIQTIISLTKRKKEINGEIFLSLVFGEEAPFSLGTDTLLKEFNFKDYNLIIVPEPTPLLTHSDYCFTHGKIHKSKFPVPVIGAEGRALFILEFFGKAAHASHPSSGINALHDAATLISELARFDIFTHIKRGRGHYVVLDIDGGDQSFTVPSYCKIFINRQVMLGETAKSVERELKKIVKALRLKSKVKIYRKQAPGPELEYKPYLFKEDKYIDLFIEKLIDAEKKIHDEKKDLRLCKFSTKSVGDFNLFGTRTKIPTLIFGPGGGNIHAPNEYVNKEEVIETSNYLLNYLMEVYR